MLRVNGLGIFGRDREELPKLSANWSPDVCHNVSSGGLTGASKAAMSPSRKWAPLKDICTGRCQQGSPCWDYADFRTHAALTITSGMVVPINVETIFGKLCPLGLALLEDLPQLLG